MRMTLRQRLWYGAAGVLLGTLAAVGYVAATPTYVPTYGARYGDDATLREILAELRAIHATLRVQRAAESAPTSLSALVSARCAGCHGATAEKDGGGFVLVDTKGKVVPLSLQEKRRILREVSSDRMPKGGPLLSEVEKNALAKFLEEMP